MLATGYFFCLSTRMRSEESIRRRDASTRRASRRVARADARVHGGERASQVEPVPARQLRDERVATVVVGMCVIWIYAVVRPLASVAFVLPVARARPPQAHRTHRAVVLVLSPEPPTSVLALSSRPNPSPRRGARTQRSLERLRAGSRPIGHHVRVEGHIRCPKVGADVHADVAVRGEQRRVRAVQISAAREPACATGGEATVAGEAVGWGGVGTRWAPFGVESCREGEAGAETRFGLTDERRARRRSRRGARPSPPPRIHRRRPVTSHPRATGAPRI